MNVKSAIDIPAQTLFDSYQPILIFWLEVANKKPLFTKPAST